MEESSAAERMLGDLLGASHTMAMEDVPGHVADHAARAGLHGVLIYAVDVRQEVLVLLTGRGPDAGQDPGGKRTPLRIDGTLAGRAFQTERILRASTEEDDRYHWWVPVLDGTERMGLLWVETDADDAQTHERMWHLASLVALLVVSKRVHSDSYARLVRVQEMSVAAEMQWNLMPPRTYTNEHVTIDAALEPAYQVNGDAFDYAVADRNVHVSIFDAMGHDTAAGLTANLAVAACRNHRRQGGDLAEVAAGVEHTLLTEFGQKYYDASTDDGFFAQTRYVTAVLSDLDTRTGMLTWTNHGHLPPVIIREGRWVSTLECEPSHPLGSDLGLPVTTCSEQLQPDDRVILYTDGITEARNADGREFGLERFLEFILRQHASSLPVPETLRRLIHSVMDYHGGRLQDDATVLLLQWHGP
ncbi:serine phosphatase RsbU (regulator of sigma subunit) [Nocardiopsis arvandica]|uniref:Serine phosphatase RsbU (Regulator of sigma subunit) n=1 Tax=Nocardiopsis sinuspersici TaxID=501010 RepID=A0A7Y9XFH1_9ACTN|nr:PP2C family protein-serine/threonine phosphatase [Nocardiopsis sinuspersici]NYH54924.1 serine phosphatase RsbU (regulator of sigma subunit) [Nocardiopsis sinuspersici]